VCILLDALGNMVLSSGLKVINTPNRRCHKKQLSVDCSVMQLLDSVRLKENNS